MCGCWGRCCCLLFQLKNYILMGCVQEIFCFFYWTRYNYGKIGRFWRGIYHDMNSRFSIRFCVLCLSHSGKLIIPSKFYFLQTSRASILRSTLPSTNHMSLINRHFGHILYLTRLFLFVLYFHFTHFWLIFKKKEEDICLTLFSKTIDF